MHWVALVIAVPATVALSFVLARYTGLADVPRYLTAMAPSMAAIAWVGRRENTKREQI